jgi:serine/threonine protein kinase
MGEVYRARDTKLDRDVAIKIVPALFANDPDRLTRFKREAKTLAALNHPNIAQIHGVEEAGGAPALVMEFVDGEDLAARIARGPVPVAEALQIARQIADALDAAHERGIVHRDLKPANIKVAHDGTVKLLDFGLAKALDSGADSGVGAMNSPTILASGPQVTGQGVILGTAAYMSPEQARGKTVDKRADIWAFGVVLYEMLTGRSPFKGDTATDAIAAIVTTDPDWTALPGGTPDRVVEVMRRCLEKDTKQRLRDIGDARAELSGAISGVATGPRHISPARRQVASWIWIGAIVLALLIGAALGTQLRREVSAAASQVTFEISVPDRPDPVISPDGSRIAFTSGGRLFVRELRSVNALELAGTQGAVTPFWSPDSSSIGYGANGKLWRISASGGQPFLICNLPQGQWDADAGGAWLPDGYIIFTNGGSPLYRVAAVGSDPTIVVKPPDGVTAHYHDATALPDARGVLFVTHGKAGPDTLNLWAGAGEPRELLQLKGQSIHDPVFSPTGHILFHRQPGNAGVWGIPFSVEGASVTGEPFLVVPGVSSPSISTTSSLVYVPNVESPPSRLVWLGRDGKVLSRIEPARNMDPIAALSPDATRAAVSLRTDDKWDIWVISLKTGASTRVTSDGTARRPRWSPDGKSIVYDSGSTQAPFGTGQASSTTVKRASADGSGELGDFGAGRDAAMSGDGARVIYMRDFDLFSRPIAGGEEIGVLVGPTTDAFPAPSPDGRHLAFMTLTPTHVGVSVVPMSAPQKRLEVSTGATWWPRWSRDGRRLFFATIRDIQQVDVYAEPSFRLGIPKPLFDRPATAGAAAPFDVSPDGERFLVVEPDKSVSRPRSIVVVLNFAPNAASASR